MADTTEILFVDDDPFNSILAKRIFKKMNKLNLVQFFSNGEEALHWWQQNGKQLPALVLLDINMPVMGGFDMLNKMEEEGELFQNTKIILMVSLEANKRWEEEKNYKRIAGSMERPITEEAIRNLL